MPKIIKIESFSTERIGFARVTTDNGNTGLGQISTFCADISAQVLHRNVAPFALGLDADDIEAVTDRVVEGSYKFPGSYVCRGLGGLDTALWDLKGKKEGKSVCELLGGTPQPFPVYGSSMRRDISPADEAERLQRLQEEKGYRAFKIRVGKVNGRDEDQWPGRTDELVPAVRKALGNETALLVDGNSGYTPDKAIEVGKLLADNGVCHFEEPCPYWEIDWTAQVTRALDMDVTGGEQDNNIAAWKYMINSRAVDIVQPDVCYIGGITRARRVAKMAEKAGLKCIPHSANHSLVTLYSLHLMGAIPNAGNYVEFSIEEIPWLDGILNREYEVKDGMVEIPAEPGMGIEVNKEWLEKADYQVSNAV